VARAHRLPILLTVLSLVAACGGEDDGYMAPDDHGAWSAGTAAITVTAQRTGLVMPVQIWYPTESAEASPYSYDDLELTHGSAAEEAPAACATPRPVVVFSHGDGGIGIQSYHLMEHLARHGYVVAALDHVWNTVFDDDEDYHAAITLRRPLDVADTFDGAADWAAAGASPAAGCIDPAAGYAVMGHSFGAFTSLAVSGAGVDVGVLAVECGDATTSGCQEVATWLADHPGETWRDDSDGRIWASVPLAPAFPEQLHLDQIAVPTLVVGGQTDTITPWDTDVEPCYRGLVATPRYLARLAGAGHYSFTDFCDVLVALGQESNGCGPEDRPPAEVMATVKALTLAFLEQVRGDTRAAGWLPPDEGIDRWEERLPE
jgi:predicted dienelactone hydrolase